MRSSSALLVHHENPPSRRSASLSPVNQLLAALIAPILACCASATAKSPPTSYAATPASAEELTLFGFDNDSIPFSRNLYLTMHPVRKYAGNPVVRRGGPGSPD